MIHGKTALLSRLSNPLALFCKNWSYPTRNNYHSAPEVLPDASVPFTAGTDKTGVYLLLGEEGATPPLIEKQNVMKYRLID